VPERTKWQRAYDGLVAIMLDPNETEARRRRASAAVHAAGRRSPVPSCHLIEPHMFYPLGNHSGGHAMATYLDYEGTADR
jgi:hypothetical protein